MFSMVSAGLTPLSAEQVLAATGAPALIHHQGRLFDTSGNLLGGSSGTDYCFQFSFYDDAVVGGGDVKLWPSGSPSTMTVTVTNGVFGVNIGDTSVGGDTLDFDFETTDTAYLNVEVAAKVGLTCAAGDGAESFDTLSPRQRVVSSGYAINANTISGYSAAQSATADQIPVLTSGNLVLGGTNPQLNVTGSNTLTLQSGVTGSVQFFSSSNSLNSSGDLTLAGDVTTTGLTIGSVALSAAGANNATSGASLVGVFDEFDNSNSATVQAVLNDFDVAIGGLAAGSSKWTDAGTFTHLISVTDDLVIGAATVAAASLFFDESAGQLDLGTDDALGGSLRLYSVTAATADPTLAADASGNLDITTAAVEISGDLEVSGGDITTAAATLNLAATNATTVNAFAAATTLNINDAAVTSTIDIGGVTSSGTNTVNIATNATAADVITIGNSHASSTVAITGGDDWSIAATGVMTLSASAAATTAIVITDTDYTNSLSIGDNNITGTTYSLIGTTSTIDFTNFDVASTGAITVAAGVGLDTNAAGALALGNTNATSVSVCNSAACDTISIGTNADADAITIGDAASDTVIVNGASLSLVIGATTVADAEITVLDGGIALSELTDSGTLTATTVDINGGAIDGTAIGAS
ncbi:MAG: hypothetical protein WAZ14_00005, partial [Patescibacteria group bacterium]